MTAISARLHVTKPDDPIRFDMGGTAYDIPCIDFGPEFGADYSIQVHSSLLTPTEQAAWLRRLSAAADSLAREVETLHGLTSPPEFPAKPSLPAPTSLGGAK